MTRRGGGGRGAGAEKMNLLELAFLRIFDNNQDQFVHYLIQNIPNPVKYLYQENSDGWFPVFRVLHLFQLQVY